MQRLAVPPASCRLPALLSGASFSLGCRLHEIPRLQARLFATEPPEGEKPRRVYGLPSSPFDDQDTFYGTLTPMRRVFPQGEITPLLLDLDDERCRIVRPLGNGDASRTLNRLARPIRLVRHLEKRFSGFDAADRDRRERAHKTSVNALSLHHISDMDLLSCVLRPVVPSVTNPSQSLDHRLKSVLRANGISTSIYNNLKDLVPYMLHRQAGGQTRLEDPSHHRFSVFFDRLSKLSDLERITTRLLHTSRGRDIIHKHAKRIVQICRPKIRHNPFPLSWQPHPVNSRILIFVNNLTINLQAKNCFVPPEISALGLELSLGSGMFAAAERYIDICLGRKGKLRVPQAVAVARTFINSLARDIMKPRQGGQNAGDLIKTYGLLTGWHVGETEMRPSMARFRSSLFDSDAVTYSNYLRILAHLGAFRTLSSEWHISVGRGMGKKLLGSLFAEVILGRQITPGQAALFSRPNYTEATGTLPEDPQLDIRQIMAWHANSTPRPQASISDELGQNTPHSPARGISCDQEQQACRIFDQTNTQDVLRSLKAALAEPSSSCEQYQPMDEVAPSVEH